MNNIRAAETTKNARSNFQQNDTSSSDEDSFGPPPLNLDADIDENDYDDEEYYDDDFAGPSEEMYSRGRSRSRSVHENDMAPDIPSLIPPSNQDPCHPAPENIEKRSGPLQEREVMALQKGLEEATLTKKVEVLKEEEDERKAAEEERLRSTASSDSPDANKSLRKIKILMLGDSGVGKTSLVNRYTKDDFNFTLVGTVGVDFKVKRVNVDGEWINLQIWDTAGQENFHKITQSYYRGVQAIMLVYDISEQKTLDSVEYWMRNIKSHAHSNVQVSLVGNKTDLRQTGQFRCVDSAAGIQIARKQNVRHYETSAKTAENVDLVFSSLLEAVVRRDRKSAGPATVGSTSIRGGSDGPVKNTLPPHMQASEKDKKTWTGWLRSSFTV